eukprot:CAMPEP_0119549364 /NCGR_PEP_ID=MMETSP1352-20130426/3080_1 /TAXON_ID=265584 /ORGANISM="Stauroneis constricta, Strain CCMP1120" /LENGTH=379 /DNA_ID=CAMNT_0007594897 /DNA_START=77 /DNA_END=1213 /DNA_ORIENTATION=-
MRSSTPSSSSASSAIATPLTGASCGDHEQHHLETTPSRDDATDCSDDSPRASKRKPLTSLAACVIAMMLVFFWGSISTAQGMAVRAPFAPPTSTAMAPSTTTTTKTKPTTFVLQPTKANRETRQLDDPSILHNARSVHPRFFHNGVGYFTMTNVLGDGDCVFRTIQLGIQKQQQLSQSNSHNNNAPSSSQQLRQMVADVFEHSSPKSTLFVSGQNIVTVQKLLHSAAASEGVLPQQYLQMLRTPGAAGGLYAGGPELTVLSNILQAPIHVYECVTNAPSLSSQEQQQQPTVQFKILDGAAPSTDELTTSCSIQNVGTFGDKFRNSQFASKIPNWALDGQQQQQQQHDAIHILMLNTSQNEKHACLLMPATMTTSKLLAP